jgi:hypothetical protein
MSLTRVNPLSSHLSLAVFLLVYGLGIQDVYSWEER